MILLIKTVQPQDADADVMEVDNDGGSSRAEKARTVAERGAGREQVTQPATRKAPKRRQQLSKTVKRQIKRKNPSVDVDAESTQSKNPPRMGTRRTSSNATMPSTGEIFSPPATTKQPKRKLRSPPPPKSNKPQKGMDENLVRARNEALEAEKVNMVSEDFEQFIGEAYSPEPCAGQTKKTAPDLDSEDEGDDPMDDEQQDVDDDSVLVEEEIPASKSKIKFIRLKVN